MCREAKPAPKVESPGLDDWQCESWRILPSWAERFLIHKELAILNILHRETFCEEPYSGGIEIIGDNDDSVYLKLCDNCLESFNGHTVYPEENKFWEQFKSNIVDRPADSWFTTQTLHTAAAALLYYAMTVMKRERLSWEECKAKAGIFRSGSSEPGELAWLALEQNTTVTYSYHPEHPQNSVIDFEGALRDLRGGRTLPY